MKVLVFQILKMENWIRLRKLSFYLQTVTTNVNQNNTIQKKKMSQYCKGPVIVFLPFWRRLYSTSWHNIIFHWLWSWPIFRPCSHFQNDAVLKRFSFPFYGYPSCVHTALSLSVIQIAAILLHSKKWSEAISEYICVNICVNNMKQNKEAQKIKLF